MYFSSLHADTQIVMYTHRYFDAPSFVLQTSIESGRASPLVIYPLVIGCGLVAGCAQAS
jgi:hypothetical protein